MVQGFDPKNKTRYYSVYTLTKRLPGVGRILRGVSTRAISRVVQDINAALARISDMTRERPGLSQHEALDELCGVRSVSSHGIAFEDGSADGSVDGNDV
eukprot:365976-Chlamydomonas_euryale.AAC.10